jgi:hypothetical protein
MQKISARVARVRIQRVTPPRSDRVGILRFEGSKASANGANMKFTAEVRQQILEHLRDGQQVRTSFNLAGVASRTISDWRRRRDDGDPDYIEFFDQVEIETARAEARHRNMIEAAAQGRPITYTDPATGKKLTANPDYKASVFLLQHCARKRDWLDVSRKELVGRDGGPIRVVDELEGWTPEEVRLFAETGTRPARSIVAARKLDELDDDA